MDGEQDGAQAQGEEQQGQQGDPQADDKQQGQKAPKQVGAPDDEEIGAALAERDEKIAELEAQIAEAAKTVESTEALAKQIEELKAASDAERCEFELRLAGAHNVTAAKALLAEHDGDVAKLKAAEPWLFSNAPAAVRLDRARARGRREDRRQGHEALTRHRRPGRRGIAISNSIASAKNYTAILDEVYQREAVSTVLNSPRRLMRASRNAKEIMIPHISVRGLGDYPQRGLQDRLHRLLLRRIDRRSGGPVPEPRWYMPRHRPSPLRLPAQTPCASCLPMPVPSFPCP